MGQITFPKHFFRENTKVSNAIWICLFGFTSPLPPTPSLQVRLILSRLFLAASKAIVFSMMVEELPSFIFGGCLRLIFTSHKIRLVLSEATPKQLQEEGGRSKTNNNNKLKNVKVEAVRLLTNYWSTRCFGWGISYFKWQYLWNFLGKYIILSSNTYSYPSDTLLQTGIWFYVNFTA